IGLRVFLHDDVDRGWKFDIPADVVAVCMGVDERSYRFVGQSLDLVEYRLTPSRILRVDNDNAIRGDEHCRIPTATLEYKQILFELFDFDDFGRLLPAACLTCANDHRQRTNGDQRAENYASFHTNPPLFEGSYRAGTERAWDYNDYVLN